jgi:hypothetical protein
MVGEGRMPHGRSEQRAPLRIRVSTHAPTAVPSARVPRSRPRHINAYIPLPPQDPGPSGLSTSPSRATTSSWFGKIVARKERASCRPVDPDIKRTQKGL